jgi:hypothetical protein
MMRNVLRVVALVFMVLAAMLSNAHAGTCSVRCDNGQLWNGSTSTAADCCTRIVSFCGGAGGATYNGIRCDPDSWNQ